MKKQASSAPPPDTLEVSVFGRGVGECIVAHIGDGEWFVVDSFMDPETDRPIALAYLESLGVDVSTAVKMVVVTHWHNDHCAGGRELLSASAAARMVCSAALNKKEFGTFIGAGLTHPDGKSGVEEFAEMLRVEMKRQQGRPASKGPVWAIADRTLHSSAVSKVSALSPSDGTQSLALHELGMSLPTSGAPKRRPISLSPNPLSVVLWIECGMINVLLGADLEVGTDDRTGWRAILNSETRPGGLAAIFKVAHHGSENAHDARVWAELLSDKPHAVVTPYLAGRKPLPSPADSARISSLTPYAYVAGPPRPARRQCRSRAAEKLLKLAAPDLHTIGGPVGHIRLRTKIEKRKIVPSLVGTAHRIE